MSRLPIAALNQREQLDNTLVNLNSDFEMHDIETRIRQAIERVDERYRLAALLAPALDDLNKMRVRQAKAREEFAAFWKLINSTNQE
jgi:hypothetical protein